MNITFIGCFLLLLFLCMVSSRPVMQRIVINNHEWEVPNEPGWDEVVKAAELVQQRLTSCATASECRKIAEEMNALFYNYPVSKQYFETHKDDGNDILSSIFKWG